VKQHYMNLLRRGGPTADEYAPEPFGSRSGNHRSVRLSFCESQGEPVQEQLLVQSL